MIGNGIPILNLFTNLFAASCDPAAIWFAGKDSSSLVVPTNSLVISCGVPIIVGFPRIINVIARPLFFSCLCIRIGRNGFIHRAGDVQHEDDVERLIGRMRRDRIRRVSLKRQRFPVLAYRFCDVNRVVFRVRGNAADRSCLRRSFYAAPVRSERRNRHNTDKHQHRKHDAQKAFFHVLLSPCVKFSYVL